jgi:protein arginine N-methyltransferase 5
VPALKPVDSTLSPYDTISQLILTTASWIDLASPDPAIANISQQVFNLEVAYAAFCGVYHVVVPAPALGNGSRLTQFARAMQEALSIGPCIQFHVLIPIGTLKAKGVDDSKHLAHFARSASSSSAGLLSEWSGWEAWNTIRQFCNYSSPLSLGTELFHPSEPILCARSFFLLQDCHMHQMLIFANVMPKL